MEEDGDNFLDDVIDFGDGRQYKVADSPVTTLPSGHSNEPPGSYSEPGKRREAPVSKEERFQDDFDRSWPKSKDQIHHQVSPRDIPPHTMLSPTHSSSRALFNERSNRLEPYSSSHPSTRPTGSMAPPSSRRDSRQETAVSPIDSRFGRDEPPHAQRSNLQVLQKGEPAGFADRQRAPLGGPPSRAWAPPPERDFPRRDGPPSTSPTSPRMTMHSPKDQRGSVNGTSSESRFLQNGRDHRTLVPEAESVSPSNRAPGTGRQLPPHLAMAPPPPPVRTQRAPSISSVAASEVSVAQTQPSERAPSTTPSQAPQEAGVPMMMAGVDVEAATKAVMHTMAERARQRRQEEEEERQRAQERAKKKAAEIEEKLKGQESARKAASPHEASKQDPLLVSTCAISSRTLLTTTSRMLRLLTS
jgi:serine/arginine repetitive matrix protein 2